MFWWSCSWWSITISWCAAVLNWSINSGSCTVERMLQFDLSTLLCFTFWRGPGENIHIDSSDKTTLWKDKCCIDTYYHAPPSYPFQSLLPVSPNISNPLQTPSLSFQTPHVSISSALCFSDIEMKNNPMHFCCSLSALYSVWCSSAICLEDLVIAIQLCCSTSQKLLVSWEYEATKSSLP